MMLKTRDFIRLFFNCVECVENFMKDAVHMEEEINEPEDVILWLWRKHNSVNYRLKDDPTTDPEHPKVWGVAFLTLKCFKQKALSGRAFC